ncbi:hypothetical protein NDU88_010092 [Pleurodeles waltl]|uniref:Uncharacterized protein n=1 Tax=Pleurodeles waltl TaxID=8319 RepID=A0AAV7PUY7_PLEWA|nr:hypothetical protein NDU88_010092 [Pleurodeles waltl]
MGCGGSHPGQQATGEGEAPTPSHPCFLSRSKGASSSCHSAARGEAGRGLGGGNHLDGRKDGHWAEPSSVRNCQSKPLPSVPCPPGSRRQTGAGTDVLRSERAQWDEESIADRGQRGLAVQSRQAAFPRPERRQGGLAGTAGRSNWEEEIQGKEIHEAAPEGIKSEEEFSQGRNKELREREEELGERGYREAEIQLKEEDIHEKKMKGGRQS